METTQKRVNLRPFILWGGAFVLLASAFGSGMRMMKHQRDDLYHNNQVVMQELRTTQLTLQGREAQAHLLEARRLLDGSLREIGKRNFGVAEQDITEAKKRLETVEKSKAVGLMNIAPVQATLASITTLSDSSGPVINSIIEQMDAGLQKTPILPADTLSPVTVAPPTANDIPDQALGNELSDKPRQ